LIASGWAIMPRSKTVLAQSQKAWSNVGGTGADGTEQHPAHTTHLATLEISRNSIAAKQLARLVAALLSGERTVELHTASAGESDALEKAFVGFTTVHWQNS